MLTLGCVRLILYIKKGKKDENRIKKNRWQFTMVDSIITAHSDVESHESNVMKKVFKLISIDSKSRAIIHNEENIDIFNFAPDVPPIGFRSHIISIFRVKRFLCVC